MKGRYPVLPAAQLFSRQGASVLSLGFFSVGGRTSKFVVVVVVVVAAAVVFFLVYMFVLMCFK